MRVGNEVGRGPMPNVASDGELDLRAIGSALVRKKWWVLGPTLLVAALAFVGVNMVTPKYKSEARILIEGRESVFLRPEAEKTGERERTVDPEAVTSQVQLTLSRDLARQVIKQLRLGERPEFDPTLRGVSMVRYALSFLGLARDPLQMTPEERALESYYERLAAYPVDKSRVIAVEFQSADPELAARVANTIADTYLSSQQNARLEQTRAASKWLAGEIDVLRQKVAEAEAKVETFRAKTNLFVGTNNTMLSNQTLGEVNRDLALARTQKADAEGKARLIRELLRRGGPFESSDILNSERLRRLSEQQVTVRAQLAEQSSTLLDGHPRIKELRAQIASLDRQVRTEAERYAVALENDARIASARVESLTNNLEQLKRVTASTNTQDVELRAFEREAKALRELLESYLAKHRETTARESLGNAPTDARIISRALVSNTPYFPKKLPAVLIATFATLFLTVGFITTGELLGGNIYRSHLAAQPAEAPVVTLDRPAEPVATVAEPVPLPPEPTMTAPQRAADIPTRIVEAPLVPEVEAPMSPPVALAPASQSLTEIARDIRAAGEAGRRVAVLGVDRNVGATQTAIGLARALAEDARVILVDLALASPNLAAIAADPTVPGIADLVRGGVSFGQIITRDRYSRVQLVTAGRLGSDNAAILMSERLVIALDALARSYDHVVVDAGAVPGMPLARMVRLAGRAVLVAPVVDAAASAWERLGAAGFTDVALFTEMPPEPFADQPGSAIAAA